MRHRLLLILVAVFLTAPAPAEEADHEIHEELRGLLKKIESAINSEQYESMAECFTEPAAITTINQEVIRSRSEIGPYFRKWFGPGGFLKKLGMKFSADALTQLNPEKTYGIVQGSGEENYTLADGRFFPMKTRWTATVMKDADGRWRIRAIHIGTNFLDNPILAKAEKSLVWAGGIGAAAGVLLAGVLAWLICRRRQA